MKNNLILSLNYIIHGENLRILHLVNEGFAGGVLRVALEQAYTLNLMGHVSIVHQNFNPEYFLDFFNSQNKPLEKIKNPFAKSSFTGYITPLLNGFLSVLVKPKLPSDFKPDWIICHNLNPIYDALALKRKYGSGIALIIHNRVFSPPFDNLPRLSILNESLFRKAKELMKKFDVLISTSKNTQTMAKELYQVNSKIVYLGCNPLKKLPLKRGNFILCAQRLDKGKLIQDIAINIAAVDKCAKVIFAGSLHRTSNYVLNGIKNSGLKNYLIIPNIPEKDLRELYSTCRFFISANSEPFGMSQIESASCGGPMICNGASGASEMFVNGLDGYFYTGNPHFPPINEYADYILSLLKDERKSWKMGHHAWQLCKNKYTWLHNVKNLIEIFEKN